MDRIIVCACLILAACGGSFEPGPRGDGGDVERDAAADVAADVVRVDEAGTDAGPDAGDGGTPLLCCQVGQTQIACSSERFGCVASGRVSLTCLYPNCLPGQGCTAGDGGVVVVCGR